MDYNALEKLFADNGYVVSTSFTQAKKHTPPDYKDEPIERYWCVYAFKLTDEDVMIEAIYLPEKHAPLKNKLSALNAMADHLKLR